MKTIIIGMAAICLLMSCNSQYSTTEISDTQKFIDSMEIRRTADSITKQVMKNVLFDTVGLYKAPVKVISAKLVRQIRYPSRGRAPDSSGQ